MADPVTASHGMQTAIANLQLAQEVGVRVQKEAMETQEQAVAPLLESIAQGGQSAAPSDDGILGGQIDTYA